MIVECNCCYGKGRHDECGGGGGGGHAARNLGDVGSRDDCWQSA